MSQISFATAQIIVENAMRANGYGGELTIAGQVINLEDSWTNNNPVNYQILRDSIAKAIVDALTATTVSGTISRGTTTAPLGQQVATSSQVNLNIATPASIQQAARVGDTVTSTILTDPAFWTWVASVSTYCSVPPPVSIMSKITTGSSTVNIGG